MSEPGPAGSRSRQGGRFSVGMTSVQAEIDAYMRSRLQITAAGAALTTVFPLGVVLTAPDLHLAPLAGVCAMFVVAMLVWWAAQRPMTGRQARAAGLALDLVLHNAVFTMWISFQESHFLAASALLFAALPIVQIERMPYVWHLGIVLGACGVVIGAGLAPMAAVDLALMGCSAVVGITMFVSVRAFVVSNFELRAAAAIRTAELAEALAVAEREIEDRRRVEAERETLRDQLMASQKMEALGTLAAGVAHDVNNLLAGITALAELLRPRVLPDGIDDLAEIQASCRRGAELTRGLLSFSRRGQYHKQVMSLESVVEHVLSLLRRTAPKSIRIESRIAGALLLEGDPSQLAQATLNLCVNAIDAMPGGGLLALEALEVEVDVERAGRLGLQPGRHVTIVVRDTGTGIDEPTRARLFEPFFTTKPQGKGTGLGLAMVYGVVSAHGGAVEVTSTLGAGATFALLFPPIDAPPPAVAAPAPTPRTPTQVTVLIVDDDTLVRTVSRRLLEQAGYTVLTAENGEHALDVHAEHPEIGVVLLDMSMPVMGGAACFHALRRRDPALRVVLASGYAIEADVRACLEQGALGFLEKPVGRSRLLSAIALAVQGQPVPILDA